MPSLQLAWSSRKREDVLAASPHLQPMRSCHHFKLSCSSKELLFQTTGNLKEWSSCDGDKGLEALWRVEEMARVYIDRAPSLPARFPVVVVKGVQTVCRRRSLQHDFCTDRAQPKNLLASVSSTRVLIR